MLETDIKRCREQLELKFNNAQDLELHWEAKAYLDCLNLLDLVLKKNHLSN